MLRHDEPGDLGDSLDRVEYLMDVEQKLTDEINADASLTPNEKRRLILELEQGIQNWNGDGDELDDGSALAIYVRKLGPRGPGSRSGSIALRPDPADQTGDVLAKPPS